MTKQQIKTRVEIAQYKMDIEGVDYYFEAYGPDWELFEYLEIEHLSNMQISEEINSIAKKMGLI